MIFNFQRISQVKSLETVREGEVVVWRNAEYRVCSVRWPEARVESVAVPGAFYNASLAQLWRYDCDTVET